jgi:hypothetical protein
VGHIYSTSNNNSKGCSMKRSKHRIKGKTRIFWDQKDKERQLYFNFTSKHPKKTKYEVKSNSSFIFLPVKKHETRNQKENKQNKGRYKQVAEL